MLPSTQEEIKLEDPQSLKREELFSKLESCEGGLSCEEAEVRLKLYGPNILKEEKVSWIKIFLRQLKNAFVYVLLLAAFLSLFLGEETDSFVILGIILVNTLFGFWQEFRVEKSIEALKKLTESKTRVLRDGKEIAVSSSEIVLGDVVLLSEGDIVTADLRLIEEASFMVDESSMTGESVPVSKDSSLNLEKGTKLYDLKNMALAGTSVVRGNAKGFVCHTGSFTYFGKIAAKVGEEPAEAPLLKAMKRFTKWLICGYGILFSGLFFLGFLQGREVTELAYIIVACLVSAVPEGLPLVITLVIVVGAIRLSRQKTYVRFLPAVEILGSTTVIASDKTGTITEGKLIVEKFYTKDEERLKRVAALCNDASDQSGDPLDWALIQWVKNANEFKKKHPRKWSYPFDSKKMLMASTHVVDGKEILFVKGAFESLKQMGSFSEEDERIYHEFLDQGYRTLAFAEGDSCASDDPSSWKIELVGLIGFLDPPKKEVKEAVEKAKDAKIHALMITGDHAKTAKKVAESVGIWKEGDLVLTGEEIEKMEDGFLTESLQKASVLARILPDHKYRIVKLLQKRGDIVAVTGDGVNDVPALKAANLGIAMGSGTEAAKSASEMVITDSNFKVIVEAINSGRVIANNIRKAIYYLMSTAVQEICLISLSIFFFFPIPLSAIQILWINIVTDGVQDKFFAFIKEEGDVMKDTPTPPSEKFIDRAQVGRMAYFGLFMGAFLFLLYLYLLERHSFELTSTIIFTSLATCQWANGLQAQKEKEPFFKNIGRSFSINPLIFLGVGLGLSLQTLIIYVFPEAFKIVPLSLSDWMYPAGSFFSAFILLEVRKWFEYCWSRFKS